MKDEDTGPDSAGYEYAMAARYRDQMAKVVGQTPTQKSIEYRDSPIARGVQIRRGSTVSTAETEYTAVQADRGQIISLERDVERLQAQLAETSGFDRTTGQPALRYTGDARETIERRLRFLEDVQLPYVRNQVAEAQNWRSANVPSAEDKMAADAGRRDAIRERAIEIADEREAQALATRVAAARRTAG